MPQARPIEYMHQNHPRCLLKMRAQAYPTPPALEHQCPGSRNPPVTSSLGESCALRSLWPITVVHALQSAGEHTAFHPKLPAQARSLPLRQRARVMAGAPSGLVDITLHGFPSSLPPLKNRMYYKGPSKACDAPSTAGRQVLTGSWGSVCHPRCRG